MPNSYKTLNDLVIVNDKNSVDLGTSNVLRDAPFLQVLGLSESSNGTTHKWIVESAGSTVGWRDPNSGVYNSKSTDVTKSINLEILDAGFDVDKALADAYKDGADAYVAREGVRHLRDLMFGVESQLINGTAEGDADGFEGLADQIEILTHAMAVHGGGSSGALTSVYLVRIDEADVQLVMPKLEMELGETSIQRITDGDGKPYFAYSTPCESYVGLQYGGTYSFARICNLDDGSHKLDDDKIAEAIGLFPAGRAPTHILMNRRSSKQLQQSRTATNATGAPAPFPTEAFGIPIVVTDAITNGESAVPAS